MSPDRAADLVALFRRLDDDLGRRDLSPPLPFPHRFEAERVLNAALSELPEDGDPVRVLSPRIGLLDARHVLGAASLSPGGRLAAAELRTARDALARALRGLGLDPRRPGGGP